MKRIILLLLVFLILLFAVSIFAEDTAPSDLPIIPVSAKAVTQMQELQREMSEINTQFELIKALDMNELGLKGSVYDLNMNVNPPSYVPKKQTK